MRTAVIAIAVLALAAAPVLAQQAAEPARGVRAAAAQTTPAPGEPLPAPPPQLVAAVHVHSRASSGSLALAELAELARAAGVDALVMSENLGYRFRYAPRWLRPFVHARVAGPTLERYGIERYLGELEQARAASPDVTLVAGVEVPPYYYWTGSLLSGDLTLHDMQRNVLVLPPAGDTAAAARLLRDLPAVGNDNLRRHGPASLAQVLPGLLLLLGAGYGLYRRPPRTTRRRLGLCLATALIGAALLAVNFPFSVSPLQPYDAQAGADTAQRLFEHVRAGGGLAFWSMPEAVDDRERSVGPVRVRLLTHPYPEALTRTRGYSGFGGVYADTVTAWEPGGVWDDALRAFQAGERAAPPWLLGESAYHWPDHAGKQLDDVLTVLQTGGDAPADLLAAMAAGRMYALRRELGSADLRLAELALLAIAGEPPAATAADADGGAGGAAAEDLQADGRAVARLGDTLTLPASGAVGFDLVLQVDDLAAVGTEVVVDVVRNGVLLRRIEATTPVRRRWREGLADGEPAAYYRVIARARRPAYLVSNPLFVRRDANGTPPERPSR